MHRALCGPRNFNCDLEGWKILGVCPMVCRPQLVGRGMDERKLDGTKMQDSDQGLRLGVV